MRIYIANKEMDQFHNISTYCYLDKLLFMFYKKNNNKMCYLTKVIKTAAKDHIRDNKISKLKN